MNIQEIIDAEKAIRTRLVPNRMICTICGSSWKLDGPPPCEHLTEFRKDLFKAQELFDADPNCEHEVIDAPGGGVKCTKCTGWFCF